jgi:hypothetical protein
MKEQIAKMNKEAQGGFLLFEGQAVMLLNTVGENHVLVSFDDGDEKVIPISRIDGVYSPPLQILIP